ncbi:MAG: DUF3817 domain-containing protein [Planctomycetota bacterium]
MLNTPISRLRLIGMIEAVSFLLLLGIAMPLKYAAGLPEAVLVVGWAHGVLFVLFGLALLQVWRVHQWPFARVCLVFGAALVPLGPFLIDKRLRALDPAEVAGSD